MYLLFDVGGTKTRIGIAENFKTISKTVIFPTPKNFERAMKLFQKEGNELLGKNKAKAICGGAPGALNKSKTILFNAPNLPHWNGKPLAQTLQKIFHAAVYIENDAALAGLGEAVFGKGKGRRIVAYLTISTGVGGSRIVDGTIDINHMGFEPGHQIILHQPGGKESNLMQLISGPAIEKRYRKKPYEIIDVKIWDKVAKDLAYGLHNVTVLWSPDIIILGGSVMNKISVAKVRQHLSNVLKIFPRPPLIIKSKLGDLAGLYGALAHLKNYLELRNRKNPLIRHPELVSGSENNGFLRP